MPTDQTNSLTPRKPLRLWPGIVAVALLWLSRVGVKAVVPGFAGFSQGMQGAILGVLAVILWWAFFSRAPRSERWGAIGLMIFGLGLTWLLRHDSMGPLWLIGYAVPVLCSALVAWAVVSRRLPDGRRRATMVATILLACGMWTLVRTDGINGDHVAQFGWRWVPSAEERLLAEARDDSAVHRSTPAAPDTPREPLMVKPGAEAATRRAPGNTSNERLVPASSESTPVPVIADRERAD